MAADQLYKYGTKSGINVAVSVKGCIKNYSIQNTTGSIQAVSYESLSFLALGNLSGIGKTDWFGFYSGGGGGGGGGGKTI